LALNDFLKASGEVEKDVEYTIAVNGKEIASKKVAKGEILSAPSACAVDEKLLHGARKAKSLDFTCLASQGLGKRPWRAPRLSFTTSPCATADS